ncbi:uncharacterized protein Z518_00951 [Rhinocladiella mackenziei CBS 650.93]|uniref:Rhinocladiella mackenziei CBS 650.93 unplaced genomic scaffold supercont1.1, whole genome shotgun sequence n=1 Tax=Rhinocladiella mackenziei CBS 650.93 TaxID=1442369 RepID=A0A0D2JK51_9EURO|nr:uncharacterized protein Z518_00951 [Rhinocladiella mackenziei CBS 650.93]KIX09870.1 hypothetical protein Z518_00951 [Rhinocladiella mackenziei CBS 650.93]
MAQSHDPRRFGYPAGLVDQSLPKLPKISIESSRPQTRTNPDPRPTPIVRKHDETRVPPRRYRTRIPQFPQSRKWARMYGSDPPRPPPKTSWPVDSSPPAYAEEKALTMREVSFEQQRAQLRKPVAPKPDTEDHERPRNASESSSVLQESGLCQPASAQCWKTAKATVTTKPRTTSRKWLGGQYPCRKAIPVRHRDSKGRRALERIAVPPQARIDKRKSRHLGLHSKKEHSSLLPQPEVLRLSDDNSGDPQDRGLGIEQRSRSLAPSLYDPEKDRKLPRKCGEILNSVDFNRNWLLPAASILPVVGQSIQATHSATKKSTEARRGNPREEISMQEVLTFLPTPDQIDDEQPVPNITVTADLPSKDAQSHGPPTRASSKAVSNIATMMPTSKPNPLPTMSGCNSHSISASYGRQNIRMREAQTPNFALSRLRMPSTESSGHSSKSPRSARSTDTLAKIEAQIQSISQSSLGPKKEKTSSTNSDARDDGPPSIPPERPLPMLPAEANPESKSTHTRSSVKEGVHGDGTEQDPGVQALHSAFATNILECLSFPSRPVSLPSTVGQTSDLAPGPLRCPRSQTDISTVSGRESGDLTKFISVQAYSNRDSLDSFRSFPCHKISGPRADRVKQKRMRDIARSKSHSPVFERAVSCKRVHHQNTAPSETVDQPSNSKARQSVDHLDQFPSVPASRRSSLVSAVVPGHASHVRQLSKASPHKYRSSQSRQPLGQSNIFVVVDSDPVTARFRAGAMSPTPSIGGSINGGSTSPFRTSKHARASSSLKEGTVVQSSPTKLVKQEIGLHSARAEKFPPLADKDKRSMRNSNRCPSSSSDEFSKFAPFTGPNTQGVSSSRPQKRRRWNSNDINLIKALQQDLEDYYRTILKQEERIRWQAHQIQMMIRFIAPVNRAGGVKAPTYLDDIANYTTTDESAQPAPKLSRGDKDNRQKAVGLGSPVQRTRKNKVGDQGHKRSNSTGNNSAASVTVTVSTDSTKAHADDVSITDPCDYDPVPSLRSRMQNHKPRKAAPVLSKKRETPPATDLCHQHPCVNLPLV